MPCSWLADARRPRPGCCVPVTLGQSDHYFTHISLCPGGGKLRVRSYLQKPQTEQSSAQGCRLSRNPSFGSKA